MWKIIFDSVKSAVRNLELVLILFVSSVVLKYLFLKRPAVGAPQTIFILFFLCLVIINLYFYSATLTALCDYKKYGKWNWKDYFGCGFKNLPAVILWVFLFILLSVPIAYIGAPGFWLYKTVALVFLIVIGYLTSLILIAVVGGVKLKDAFVKLKVILSREILKLIGCGIYILFIAVLTSVVITMLWNNIVLFDNIIIKQIIVLTAEFVWNFASVVIMATVVGVVFSSPKIKKVDISDKVVL